MNREQFIEMHPMAGGEGGHKTPQERTAELFSKPVEEVAQVLHRADVIVTTGPMAGRSIRLMHGIPYPKVGEYYGKPESGDITTRKSGDVLAAKHKGRGGTIHQFLVVTQTTEEPGACVRIDQVSYWDEDERKLVKIPTEGGIAKKLGLNERSRVRLEYTDDGDLLHLVQYQLPTTTLEEERVASQQAHEVLGEFFSGKAE